MDLFPARSATPGGWRRALSRGCWHPRDLLVLPSARKYVHAGGMSGQGQVQFTDFGRRLDVAVLIRL